MYRENITCVCMKGGRRVEVEFIVKNLRIAFVFLIIVIIMIM